ncbi:MAG: hypothetical protein ABIQ73_12295 [Acidimicrobiales bacterium]
MTAVPDLYFVSEALDRLHEVTNTRRGSGDPMRPDSFTGLELERFVGWCEASPDHAAAIGFLVDHLIALIEATAFIRYDLDEATDLIDSAFDSMRRSIGG